MRSTDAGASFPATLTCGYADFDAIVHVDHHARAFVAGDPNRLCLWHRRRRLLHSANARADTPRVRAGQYHPQHLELYPATSAPISPRALRRRSALARRTTAPPARFSPARPRHRRIGTGTPLVVTVRTRRSNPSWASAGISPSPTVASMSPWQRRPGRWRGADCAELGRRFAQCRAQEPAHAVPAVQVRCARSAGQRLHVQRRLHHLIAGTYRLWETVVGTRPAASGLRAPAT